MRRRPAASAPRRPVRLCSSGREKKRDCADTGLARQRGARWAVKSKSSRPLPPPAPDEASAQRAESNWRRRAGGGKRKRRRGPQGRQRQEGQADKSITGGVRSRRAQFTHLGAALPERGWSGRSRTASAHVMEPAADPALLLQPRHDFLPEVATLGVGDGLGVKATLVG